MRKQKTIEKVAENFWLNDNTMSDIDRNAYMNGFLACNKWQQQQNKNLYSEEEVLDLMYYIRCNAIEVDTGWQMNCLYYTDKELLEQFKKK